MATQKWTEDRTNQLTAIVGNESPVTVATVTAAAEALDTSTRSVASKLRKMGFTVDSTAAVKGAAYTAEQEEALHELVTGNSGEYTYGEIAAAFEGGAFSAKSIQGKILSMELTSHVRPTPKAEVVRTYTDAEEAKFVKLANSGATIEDIASALGKETNSVRGKALSLLRSGDIAAIPKTSVSTAKEAVDPLAVFGEAIGDYTVEAIAEQIGKSVRGVKTMLTRRGITVADYDGAAKAAKAAAAKEASAE